MAYERTLKDVENFVFDLDGTVWEWNRLKDGVAETIDRLRGQGKTLYFLTNNSILTREQAAAKITDLGIKTDTEHVLTAAYIAAQALDKEDVRQVYLIGEDGLRTEFKRAGIELVDAADDVMVAVDRNFSFWKMADAVELIRDGATLWTTTTDTHWWAGDRTLPGTGALTAGIQAAAETDQASVLGKPSKYARDVVMDTWSLRPHNTVLVGDNLKTDIVFGNKMGYKTGLVMGGTSTEDDLNRINDFEKPHIVFREFSRILQKI